MRRCLVYLAGPLNHGGAGSYEQNMAVAVRAAEQLRSHGLAVFCPHEAFAPLRGHVPEGRILALCCDVLNASPSDAVVWLMPGWTGSDGARTEAVAAARHGLRLLGCRDVARLIEKLDN